MKGLREVEVAPLSRLAMTHQIQRLALVSPSWMRHFLENKKWYIVLFKKILKNIIPSSADHQGVLLSRLRKC